MQHGPWLKDFMVFLVAAGLIVPLFHRARIGAVLGFLLIGVAVGPYGLGQLAAEHPWIRYLTIEDRPRVEPFAELGVMFLLFTVGLELSLARLWSMRRLLLGLGGAQFVLSAAAIGLLLMAMGLDGKAAIVLGLCLAMSSTAIIMQLLEEQGRTATALGHTAVAVLLFQDLMVAPVLFATTVLGRDEQDILLGLGHALLQAAIALAVIAFLGTYLLRPLFRIAGRTGSRELILAMTLLVAISLASTTGHFGLSTALGAFLAGALLSETEYRHHINIDLAPVKGLLLGLFFISVGMSVDISEAWQRLDLLCLAVAGLFVVKAAVIYAACAIFKLTRAVAAETAILLAQAGEFAFVVIALAAANGLFEPGLTQIATAAVGISMMIAPAAAFAARSLGRRLERPQTAADAFAAETRELADHVVIGGYGRVGRTVARLLEAENVPFIALDTNAQLVAEERRRTGRVYYGDAARPELLAHVGASRARAFVVTVNAPRAAEAMVAAARRQQPDAVVVARARDADHARRLLKLGAVGVIPEAEEASLQLGGRLLEALGVPDEAVSLRLSVERELKREGLNASGNQG